MNRSIQLKDSRRKGDTASQGIFHEGTAARTRPLSFDEIMSWRERNPRHKYDYIALGASKEKIDTKKPGHIISERMNGHEKIASIHGKKLLTNEVNGKYTEKSRSDECQSQETESAPQDFKCMQSLSKFQVGNVMHASNSHMRPVLRSKIEVVRSHSEYWEEEDQLLNNSAIFGKERKYRAEVESRVNKSARRSDVGTGYDTSLFLQHEKKESSKYLELREKRRCSNSRKSNQGDTRSMHSRNRVNHKRVSRSPSEHRHESHHVPVETADIRSLDDGIRLTDRSRSHYKKHGVSTTVLGGYSPRKRKMEPVSGNISPLTISPEKKIGKWDVVAQGTSTPANMFLDSEVRKQPSASITESSAPTTTAGNHTSMSSTSPLFNNKNLDFVQLTEATRPIRRLYVENVPTSASEKDLMECFNNLLTSTGAGHVQRTQPCISCMVHKDKGQALLEFLTPEDATAALCFDGSSILSSTFKIRRPKDFVEVATGGQGKTANVNSVFDFAEDSPNKIFIGGISKAISSAMLMDILSTFGPLKAYKFEDSPDLHNRFAFVEFSEQGITARACASINGMKLGGCTITAVRAIPNGSPKELCSENPSLKVPAHALPLLESPTRVLKLKNMFDPGCFASMPQPEVDEVLEDVRLECSRFCPVKSVNVVKFDDLILPPESLAASPCGISSGPAGTEPSKTDDSEGKATKEETPETLDPLEYSNVTTESNGETKELCSSEKVGAAMVDVTGTDAESYKNGKVVTLERRDNGVLCRSEDPAFEPGSVLVEFSREEAACVAAHCLHGRLYDDRAVTVAYATIEALHDRFPR